MAADLYADYQRMVEDVRRAQQRMTEIRAEAESGDGLIRATVGGSGELVELWLDPRIYRTPDSTSLAKSIMDTIDQATELAQKERFAILAGYLPEDAAPEATDFGLDPFLHELGREVEGGERR